MVFALQDVLSFFSEKFGTPDICLFSPGRANIIGEHTDYTNGFVLPFATEQGIFFAGKRAQEKVITIHSLETAEAISLRLDSDDSSDYSGWKIFVLQVLKRINYHTFPTGMNIVLGGNLPLGAGMSSSSSLTCGLLALFNESYALNYSKKELLQLAVEAEHGTGVNGGMMDQYAIYNGVKNFALCLDCESLTHQTVEVNFDHYGFYLVNTNVKHSLVDSQYNQRRSESEKALEEIRTREKNLTLQFRDPFDVTKYAKTLPPVLYKRAKHVFSENSRVLKMVNALTKKDIEKTGSLLTESHDSLSKDYMVSCDELDFFIEASKNIVGWIGGRMMGGGFGGCTINLLQHKNATVYFDELHKKYYREFGLKATFIPIRPSSGIHRIQ